MLLYAFKNLPPINVKIGVQGPIGPTSYDLSQFDFIQDMLGKVLGDTLVEPRRGAISLDYDLKVEEVSWGASFVIEWYCACHAAGS